MGPLCAAVAFAWLGAAMAAPNALSVEEIRSHRISLLDSTDSVVAAWYSTSPGSYHGPS
jgi:hypothetical protein